MPKLLLSASLRVLGMTMAFSLFSCSLMGLYLASGAGIRLPYKGAIAITCSAALMYTVFRILPWVGARLERVGNSRQPWSVAVLVGLALRLGAWLATMPVQQVNDGLSYFQLANRLYLGQPYELDGHAFWPPGTPFIYAAFMSVLGQHAWIVVVVNCMSFLLAAVAIQSVCRSLGLTRRDAGIAVAILAFWPGLFLPTAQVSKEILLIGMLSAVMALLLSRRIWAALFGGFVSGLVVLTQPSLMLLPLLMGVALLAARVSAKAIAARTTLLIVGMIIVIAPWSYRNFQVFGEFVPVSTNAGLVLHAGNQPRMVKPLGEVGGFLYPPTPATPMTNDALLSRWHTEEAIRFIRDHQSDFVVLTWNRLVLTMGDDSDSAYRSLRLTKKVSDKTYFLVKTLSNAYWMLIATILASVCWAICKAQATQAFLPLAPLVTLAALATLYLMAVHGIAEGGGRHHMAWTWLYALVLSVGVTRIKAPAKQSFN